MRQQLHDYIQFYENLRPDSLQQLDQLVTEDVYFCDPFNEVRGVGAYRHILADMFRRCDSPQFKVELCISEGESAFLRWRFEFGANRRCIIGVSELSFSPEGKVSSHVDYWDTSSQVYESVPVLGWILRSIRRNLSAGVPGRN